MLQELDLRCHCTLVDKIYLYLPPLMKLKLSVNDPIAGELPSTLRFLEFTGPVESFERFWRQYVTPLKSLISFKRDDKHHTGFIDFRGLSFPKHLSYFNVHSRFVVLDSLPDSIKKFYVGDQCQILIDPSKGESISSIRNKVLSTNYCKWGTINFEKMNP
ncbi:unnamed protein product [Ambrosiozyma monospora]|uniref:Unnamed protein product n=1 Tax=Ambrosiozyma monospora TaxID=43982 RepID=A0ACB5T5B4_AMBMO|nr:unnamed protein product [Ambrosiozyma monospora]